jgi:hypothetical protein
MGKAYAPFFSKGSKIYSKDLRIKGLSYQNNKNPSQ